MVDDHEGMIIHDTGKHVKHTWPPQGIALSCWSVRNSVYLWVTIFIQT